MEQKTREEKRQFIGNQILLEFQLGLCPIQTYGDFVDIVKNRMLEKLGECTEEDEQWALELIDQFNKANAPKQPKKKNKE